MDVGKEEQLEVASWSKHVSKPTLQHVTLPLPFSFQFSGPYWKTIQFYAIHDWWYMTVANGSIYSIVADS